MIPGHHGGTLKEAGLDPDVFAVLRYLNRLAFGSYEGLRLVLGDETEVRACKVMKRLCGLGLAKDDEGFLSITQEGYRALLDHEPDA